MRRASKNSEDRESSGRELTNVLLRNIYRCTGMKHSRYPAGHSG